MLPLTARLLLLGVLDLLPKESWVPAGLATRQPMAISEGEQAKLAATVEERGGGGGVRAGGGGGGVEAREGE